MKTRLGFRLLFFSFFLFGSCQFVQQKKDKDPVPASWPYRQKIQVKTEHGMVVSDAKLASQIGQEILLQGGNAVDAAIATAFALSVVHPAAGNLGGGGFMVAYVKGTPYALDFREVAPQRANRNMFLGGVSKKTDSVSSHLSAGVPGSVAGLFAAYEKLGSAKISWAGLLSPAIKLARDGFEVDELFAKLIERSKEKLQQNKASSELFFPGGILPKVGSLFKNPEMAATLLRIAEKGSAGFYDGVTAGMIVKEMEEHEGLISAKDLRSYQAKWRTPLQFTYRSHHIISMPPPSSGGMTLAMVCHILDKDDLSKMGWHSGFHMHLVMEAMRRAFIARNASMGDPDFVDIPEAFLLSTPWAEENRKSIDPLKATPSLDLTKPVVHVNDGPHTTHFSVVDKEGNAVALTTTVNFWFGSGITVPGAGFVLNNEMDDFATAPGIPNGFGLLQGDANTIAPGKRMLSSMTPTVVLNSKGDVILVTGAAGGPTIITAVYQIVSNLLDFHLPVESLVRLPRFHMQDFPDRVLYEKEGMTEKQKKELIRMGYDIEERDHLADAPSIGKEGKDWVGMPEVRSSSSFAAGW